MVPAPLVLWEICVSCAADEMGVTYLDYDFRGHMG
jgi:hypothetical protein